MGGSGGSGEPGVRWRGLVVVLSYTVLSSLVSVSYVRVCFCVFFLREPKAQPIAVDCFGDVQLFATVRNCLQCRLAKDCGGWPQLMSTDGRN